MSVRSPATLLATVLSVGIIVAGCASAQDEATSEPTAGTSALPPALALGDAAVPYEGVVMAPPIDLVRPDGTAYEVAEALGSPLLVFFGYTHCPDVCPTTFGTLINVLDERPDAEVVFITVDPERDTPEWMAGWMEYLPDEFTGLTGTPAQIRSAADAYGARYARGEDTDWGYLMVHSADVYLIDDAGRLLARYPFGTKADAIVADLALAVPQQRSPTAGIAAG
jgi:protein SCO1/2